MLSPPRPTRVLHIEIPLPKRDELPSSVSNSVIQHDSASPRQNANLPGHKYTPTDKHSPGQIEGRLMEQALQSVLSLPQVCQQVAIQTRDQCVELNTQQRTLTHKQEILKAAQKKYHQFKDKLANMQRNTNISENDLRVNKQKTTSLTSEIEILLTEANRFELDIFENDEECEKYKNLYKTYEQRITDHARCVDKLESDLQIRRKLDEQRALVAALQTQKNLHEESSGSVNGACAETLRQQKSRTTGEIETLKREAASLREEFQQERNKQLTLLKSTQVLERRNSAQLTRLRKRLHEIQGRNRHWREQAARLMATINHIQDTDTTAILK